MQINELEEIRSFPERWFDSSFGDKVLDSFEDK